MVTKTNRFLASKLATLLAEADILIDYTVILRFFELRDFLRSVVMVVVAIDNVE